MIYILKKPGHAVTFKTRLTATDFKIKISSNKSYYTLYAANLNCQESTKPEQSSSESAYDTVSRANYPMYYHVCIWASKRKNLFSGVCVQHRRRPACAYTQSGQRLCYSLLGKHHM